MLLLTVGRRDLSTEKSKLITVRSVKSEPRKKLQLGDTINLRRIAHIFALIVKEPNVDFCFGFRTKRSKTSIVLRNSFTIEINFNKKLESISSY